jgi:hypothetical protein
MYYGDFSKPTANLTKSSQAEPSRPKEIKRKGLDFLGFSWPDFAFQWVIATPNAKKLSLLFHRRPGLATLTTRQITTNF